MATDTELSLFVEYLRARKTAAEDALDLARTTIASLHETDEGFLSDLSDLMMAWAGLSTEMNLRFARTSERFFRVYKALPPVAG